MGRALLAWWVVPAAILGVAGGGCTPPPPPTLNAVLPDTGYPRQLLAVDGATLYGSVVWDVGLGTETAIYNGLFGTTYFQIPDNAAPGLHPVAIRNSLGTSSATQVMVLPSQGTFPAPRIEDIGVLLAAGSGPVDVGLTIAAANLDLNATVTVTETVGGVPVTRHVRGSVSWGALPVDYLQHHSPDTFGYPVYHYAQLLAIVEGVGLGSTLQVTVTNADGKSSMKERPLPASLAALDGDDDGLLGSWEDGSYTAPSGNTVPLSQMGTSKWRKDILIEVDWMAAAVPQPSLWQKVEQVFRDAPVLNPDGSRGVNVIIDRGQGGLFTQGGQALTNADCLTLTTPPASANGCATIANFFTYKATNFSADRRSIFHYALFGQKGLDDQTDVSGSGERFGNDFFVTLASLFSLGNDPDVQTGHFVHELGHNLGFSHGDLMSNAQNFSFKPNLPSVMNYAYTDDGVDIGCDLVPDGVYTYSQGTLATLDESFVDETIGICDHVPVDMNLPPGLGRGDGQYTAGPIELVGNNTPNEKSDDFDQWGHLLLNFTTKGSGWNGN